MSGASSPAAAAAAPGAPVTLDQQSTRDSFIPLFDGAPSGYQEWRKRITIYSKKMELMKRTGEAALNLLGSLQGTAWKLVKDYDLEKADKPGAFAEILLRLGKAFKYDSKAEMPADLLHTSSTVAERPIRPSCSSSPTTMTSCGRSRNMEFLSQRRCRAISCSPRRTSPRRSS